MYEYWYLLRPSEISIDTGHIIMNQFIGNTLLAESELDANTQCVQFLFYIKVKCKVICTLLISTLGGSKWSI